LAFSRKYGTVWYHPASSKFYLIIFIPLLVSGKLTSTLSGFIARVKPASSGLLCAWREVLILRQHIFKQIKLFNFTKQKGVCPNDFEQIHITIFQK
jgi:hypothetical protein